jgi:hypothetical protein
VRRLQRARPDVLPYGTAKQSRTLRARRTCESTKRAVREWCELNEIEITD